MTNVPSPVREYWMRWSWPLKSGTGYSKYTRCTIIRLPSIVPKQARAEVLSTIKNRFLNWNRKHPIIPVGEKVPKARTNMWTRFGRAKRYGLIRKRSVIMLTRYGQTLSQLHVGEFDGEVRSGNDQNDHGTQRTVRIPGDARRRGVEPCICQRRIILNIVEVLCSRRRA